MTPTIETNAAEVGRKIRLAAERVPALLFQVMVNAFRRDGARWVATMSGPQTHGPLVLGGNKHPTAAIATRTGALSGSFGYSLTGSTLADLALRKYSTSRTARVHELGETIYPKKGRFLAIPMPGLLTSSGVATKKPADFPDAFFYESANGGFFLARQLTFGKGAKRAGEVKGIGNQIELLFKLATSVYIPARLGMRKTHRAQELNRLEDLQSMLTTALEQVA